MKSKIFKLIGLCLAGAISLTGCFSSNNETASSEITKEEISDKEDTSSEEPTVIRIGAHYNVDPNAKDTEGNYLMIEEDRIVHQKAIDKVLKELNVKLEFVAYPGDTTESLLQSVLANDPIADVVVLYSGSQGTILGQNILQPLDDYIEYFSNKEEIPVKVYGKQYFLAVGGNYSHPLSPLVYNINYIEQVDALKENGETIYPTDLYKEGKWTWSVFKDYLTKIEAHYANSQAPARPENRIDSYRTDYRDTLIQAMHSAGGSIYGADGLGIENDRTKMAVEFVKDLIDNKLLTTELAENSSNSIYSAHATSFEMGESVFSNIEDWRLQYSSSSATERGEGIGFVPFPRPDDMEIDDPNYRQARTGGDSYAILKGIDEEKIPKAIQAYEMWSSEQGRLWEELGYKSGDITTNFDLFHQKVGKDIEDIYWESRNKTLVNEISNMTGVYSDFMKIAGDSIFGIGGSPSFDVAIESKKQVILDKISEMEAVLAGTEIKDNIAPEFTQVTKDKKYAFAKGTDPSTIIWADEFTVKDNVDPEIDPTTINYETLLDYNKVGFYKDGVIGTASDSSENKGEKKIDVVIYDGENTTPPTIVVKTDYRDIIVGEDTSIINWSNDFIDTATDKDGLDLKNTIVADLSEINTSVAGSYNVLISVVDYARNENSISIQVNVIEEKEKGKEIEE